MKRALLLLLVLTSLLENMNAQAIHSFWLNKRNLEIPYVVRNKTPKKITLSEKVIYYNSISTSKRTYYFDDATHFMCESFNDDNILVEVDSVVLDCSNRIVYEAMDRAYPLLGWVKTITRTLYKDSNTTIDSVFNDHWKLQRVVNYHYGERGYLKRIDFFNARNEKISSETADYDYESSTYLSKTYNNRNELVFDVTNACTIDTSMDVRNKQGDFVKVKWENLDPKDRIYHELIYKYDSYGNWTESKRYVVENRSKSLNTIKKRIIEYQP